MFVPVSNSYEKPIMTAKQPLTIDTLGACIDGGYTITMHCEARHNGLMCHYSKVLDLEKLAKKLGRDHSSMHNDLVPHLWCLKCGSKNVSIRLGPPTLRDLQTGELKHPSGRE